MKYGLILYKETDNLGDDIQSYAAMQFLPRVDYVIDREALDEFVPDKKEYVATIMNGWYLHKKTHFPFTPYIHPLLISMHFTENDLITKRGYEFLDGYTKDFLKPYGKIGCRDLVTEEVLKEKGYDTYFSGCMTLTLDQIGKKKVDNYICVIDMKEEIVEKIHTLFPEYEIKIMSHWLKPEESASMTLEKRIDRVKEYLTIYQNAKLIITDRLHCALPALALETPVALIYYDYNADRLSTFKDYVTYYSEGEFMELSREELLKLKNPTYYKKIRKSLKETVSNFIKESEILKLDIKKLPDVKIYQEFVKREQHTTKLFTDQIKALQDELAETKKQAQDREKELYDTIVSMDKEIARLYPFEQEINELNYQRTFRMYKKYYNYRKKKVSKKLPRGGLIRYPFYLTWLKEEISLLFFDGYFSYILL